MKRRDFLVGSFAGLVPSVAGCSQDISDETEEDYTFNLYNTGDQRHSFEVEIGAKDRANSVYDNNLELEAGKGEEGISINGVPASIAVTIDSTIEHDFAWPASYHDLGTAANVASIWYDPAREQEVNVLAD